MATKLDEGSCVCELNTCKLFIENPITLICGSTICQEHVEKYRRGDRFKCELCKREHQVPDDGFKVNKSMQNLIVIFLQLNESRKNAQILLDKLTRLTQKFDAIEADVFVYDYFASIRNKIDLHREKLIKEINDKSDELIDVLKEKEKKCQLNAKQIGKVFPNKNNELIEWRHQLRIPQITSQQIDGLSFKMKQHIKLTQHEIRKYKFNLQMGTQIEFKPFENSWLGELSETKIHVDLADRCGHLEQTLTGHPNAITCVKAAEDRLLSGSEDVLIKIWNLKTGQCLQTLDEHKSSIANIDVFKSTSKKFISASRGGTIKIWNIQEENFSCLNTIHCETGISSICLICDNKLASCSENGFIYIYNLDQAELVEKFEAHGGAITSLISTGSLLISGSADTKIKIWRLNSYECSIEMKEHKRRVNCLELTHDKKLVSGSDDGILKIWNIDSGRCLHTIELAKSINKLKCLTRELIAIASHCDIIVYDLAKMVQLRQMHRPHGVNPINCIDLTVDGLLVTSSFGDNSIKLWLMLNNNANDDQSLFLG